MKNNNTISKAGITIHLEQSKERPEPFDITLYFKKPKNYRNILNPGDEDSITTTGKLTVKIGKYGLVEFFAENICPIENEIIKQEVVV